MKHEKKKLIKSSNEVNFLSKSMWSFYIPFENLFSFKIICRRLKRDQVVDHLFNDEDCVTYATPIIWYIW